MKKSELQQIIKEELDNALNEDVFVLWADRVTGNLANAVKKAKYQGKGGVWSNDFKTNAKEGHGTVFFVNADNVADAKKKVLSATEKNKVDTNVYTLSENITESKVSSSFAEVLKLLRTKIYPKLNDDELYELNKVLKNWFNNNV